MKIIQASIKDAEEILALQKLAFQIEGELYNNYDIAPLKQTLEEIRADFKTHIVLKAVFDGKIVGTVRAYEKDGTCYIGRLAVFPEMQNQGIGAALMREIEICFKSKRFELFVGSQSIKNQQLYQKLGYSVFMKKPYGCGSNIEILFMGKNLKRKGEVMLDFIVDKERCAQCGQCVADCPMHIIGMGESGPAIAAEDEAKCLRCQHCLAVCPSGAISIASFSPEKSRPITGDKPSSTQMEVLIRSRRSIRQFQKKDLDRALLEKLLNVAACAPTGKNAQQVRFTVINDQKKLAQFRQELMTELGRLVRAGKIPPGLEFMSSMLQAWEEKHVDLVFRDAPNLVVTSAPKTLVSPIPDCLIAMTTLELFARTEGVGTLWCGVVKFLISDLLPDLGRRLGIPEDHLVGYVMLLGYPAVQYTRMTQHKLADIHWVQ